MSGPPFPIFRFEAEIVILSIFVIELVLKWLGQGVGVCGRSFDSEGRQHDTYFWGKDAAWNRLDFIVVIVGLLDLIPGIDFNIGAIRVVR